MAVSDIFLPCRGNSSTAISSFACQGNFLLPGKVPALYLFPLFGFLFLFNGLFCTQGFSPSQGKPWLDLSYATPRSDFCSWMIICLPPPGTFSFPTSGVEQEEAAARTSWDLFLCNFWPCDTTPVGQRAPCGHFICSLFFVEVTDKDDWETRGSIVFHSQPAMKCTVVHSSVKPSSFSQSTVCGL